MKYIHLLGTVIVAAILLTVGLAVVIEEKEYSNEACKIYATDIADNHTEFDVVYEECVNLREELDKRASISDIELKCFFAIDDMLGPEEFTADKAKELYKLCLIQNLGDQV